MADNYLQTAETFEPFNDEEQHWLEYLLTSVSDWYQAMENDEKPNSKAGEPNSKAGELYPHIDYQEVLEGGLFNWEWHEETGNDHVPTGIYSLRISGDEWPNTAFIARALYSFLVKFDRDDVWGMTWAFTCSKMRSGEFSGGGFVVSKEDVHFIDCGGWAYDKIKEIEEGRKKS